MKFANKSFRQYILAIACILSLCSPGRAQKKSIGNETPEEKQQRMAWWTHDRFGMFIHWGLYALPARQAKAAGMKYAVLTTKHHEGFCLFDSKYTDYKAVHLMDYPNGPLLLRGYAGKVKYARFLPAQKPPAVVPVIELVLQ